MNKLYFLLIIGLFAIPTAYSQECSSSAQDSDSCAQSGKYSAHDKYGKVVLGAGKCATDSHGEVVCSDTPDGGAMADRYGKVITGKGECMRNQTGDVMCAPTQGGGIAMNKLGQVKTGPGRCINDKFGQVICSTQPYGAAALDNFFQPICAGGCVAGQ